MLTGFMGWFNKRGLSEVIVSLIVISLSIVAIALVWVVVNNLISSQSSEVDLGKFTLDMKIKSVVTTPTGVDVTIKREAGTGGISALKFFISDGTNTQEFQEATAIQELEEKTFHLNYSGIVKKVSIAPSLGSGSNAKLGNIVDNLEFDSNTAVKNMPGLVSWWKFETQNSVDNSTPDEMGRNFMFFGTLFSPPPPILTTGKFGNAYRFNLVPSFLQSSPSETQNNVSVTYVTWINKMANYPGDSGIVGDLISQPTGIFIDSTNHVVFIIDDSRRFTSSRTINNNQWTHIAGSYFNNTVKIYVDGESQNFTTTRPTDPDNHALGVGGINIFTDYPLNGTIDEVMIFNRSLSDEEIKALYNTNLG